jgi:hypothetical protein
MKNIKTMQLILGLTFTVLFSSLGSAQDITQNEPHPQMEKEAKDRVEKWDDELSLTAKQALLLQKKFVEFAIKRESAMNVNAPEEEKLNRLKDLKILETREIRDILTLPQFNRYIRLLEEEAAKSGPQRSSGSGK